jgi:predicted transcriptional regulator
MPREAKYVTEAELGLLRVLWERGRCSIRQLTRVLYPGDAGPSQYATVQKQLDRLEAKGFVARDRSLFVHTFTASLDRDELIGRQLREVADKLCGGSLAPILSQLARHESLTPRQAAALRELIDAQSQERPKPAKRRKS